METPKYKVNVPEEVGQYLRDNGTIHEDPAGATFITLPDVFTLFDDKVYRVATMVESVIDINEPALTLGICSNCLGSGEVSVPFGEANWIRSECSKCKGTGREGWAVRARRQCESCYGTGIYKVQGRGRTCEQCNGTGIKDEEKS